MSDDVFDALVIGGGINGLSALHHLGRLGARRVGLVEPFSLGHDRGSSHGAARVTRSAYAAPEYVRLMRRAHREEWPLLEKDAGRRLVHPNPGIFTGPPCARFDRYLRAVEEEGVDAEVLTPAEARERYPQFSFANVERVLLDRTAGVVAAEEAMASLAALARERGARVHENTLVRAIDPTAAPVKVETSRGALRADRLIVAAGAWARDLLPFLKSRLTVARQTVGYFAPSGDREDYRPGRFPVWVYMEEDENHLFYGMPEFGRPGVKVGRHLRVGVDDDPDDAPEAVEEEKIEDLRRFMAGFFARPEWTLAGAEHCLYTNAPNEDFIIDLHPENPRIAFGAGFSGHGFKFGPLTGRLLAELAWEGKISIPEADLARRLFSLEKQALPDPPETKAGRRTRETSSRRPR